MAGQWKPGDVGERRRRLGERRRRRIERRMGDAGIAEVSDRQRDGKAADELHVDQYAPWRAARLPRSRKLVACLPRGVGPGHTLTARAERLHRVLDLASPGAVRLWLARDARSPTSCAVPSRV